jgi:hypothetical protein
MRTFVSELVRDLRTFVSELVLEWPNLRTFVSELVLDLRTFVSELVLEFAGGGAALPAGGDGMETIFACVLVSSSRQTPRRSPRIVLAIRADR